MKGEFYKMDFRAWNVGTVDLTLEQEAAYLRLCHAMYDVRGPVPNSTRFLQSIFRCGNTKATTLANQLIAAGKIAVTSDGRLINHRVTEELEAREKVSAVRRVAGERGGSASRATAERLPSDPRPNADRLPTDDQANHRKSLIDNDGNEAIATAAGSREEKSREEEIQKEDKPLSDARGTRSQSDFPPNAFAIWWQIQPNKVGKDAAERAFNRVRKSGRVTFAELIDGLKSYIATKPATRDWCHPTTWLNQGRWADEPAPPVPIRAAPNGRPPSAQETFLAHSRSADREMRGEDDQSPFLFDAAPKLDAGGYANGHARPALLEPPGRDCGFPPPRYPGQTRPH